jgi:DNA-binding CsgD family transcriptional regulator
MAIVQKSELLGKIKDDLTRLKNNAEIEKDSKDFKKILRVIDTELNSPQDWEQFATHFDSVHDNYLQLLKEKFPDLTASELKLCAFLRLNLNTKEIAQLMNISVRGVETSRYRLRKKLSLSNEANLFDYLIGLANTN